MSTEKQLIKLRKERAVLNNTMSDLDAKIKAADKQMRELRKEFDTARRAERQVASQITKLSKSIATEDDEL